MSDFVTYGIAHLALNVKDMKKSIDFYHDALGFELAFSIQNDKGEPWIEYLYTGGDTFLELFYGGEVVRPYEDKNAGFSHICFQTKDIHKTVDKIKAAGYPIDSKPEINSGTDLNLQAWTHDPDGNRIELMQMDPESPQSKALKKYLQ